jgi:hypothetical protein
LSITSARAAATGARGLPDVHALRSAVAKALLPSVHRGLGFDLRLAVEAGRVRLLAIHTVDGRPLPRDWAIPVFGSERVVACAQLPPPFFGVAALVVRSLAPLKSLDAAGRKRVVAALANLVLADLETVPRPGSR